MENILKKVMRRKAKREKKNLLLIPVQQHTLDQHQQHQVNLVNLSPERNKTVAHFVHEVASLDQGVNFRVNVLTFNKDIQLPVFPLQEALLGHNPTRHDPAIHHHQHTIHLPTFLPALLLLYHRLAFLLQQGYPHLYTHTACHPPPTSHLPELFSSHPLVFRACLHP